MKFDIFETSFARTGTRKQRSVRLQFAWARVLHRKRLSAERSFRAAVWEVQRAREEVYEKKKLEAAFAGAKTANYLLVFKASIERAQTTLSEMSPAKTVWRTTKSETKKTKDGRVVLLECTVPCAEFSGREVSRFCVRRYALSDDVFVDVSYRATEDDVRHSQGLWDVFQTDVSLACVYVWTCPQIPRRGAISEIKGAISKVMVVGALRRDFRILSSVLTSWWDGLTAISLADALPTRQLLTKSVYSENLPFTGWEIHKKQRNSVRGVVVYDARERALSLLTDGGLLARVADVWDKDFPASFVVECDVVVHTRQVVPVRQVKLYQPQSKVHQPQQRASLLSLHRLVKFFAEKFGSLVHVLQNEAVMVPVFYSQHRTQLCADIRVYAKAIAHDEPVPHLTNSEKYIPGAIPVLDRVKGEMLKVSYGKDKEARARAVLAVAEEFIKTTQELNGNASDFIEETVRAITSKPLAPGILFVSPDDSRIFEWEAQENAEFEFLVFKKEKDTYTLTVAVDQDIVGENRLNIPKTHRFIEEYFGKQRVAAGLIPVRFRPFWRQGNHVACDELVSAEDLDKKLVRLRWVDDRWVLVQRLDKLGLGLKQSTADAKWTQLQQGRDARAFWKPSIPGTPVFVELEPVEQEKRKLMRRLAAQACVLNLGTASVAHYAENKATDVIFVTNSNAEIEELAHQRQEVVFKLSAKAKEIKDARQELPDSQHQPPELVYPRMSGLVYRKGQLAEEVKALYHRQVNFVYCNLAHSFLEDDFEELRELAPVVQPEVTRICLLFIDGRMVHEDLFKKNAIKPGNGYQPQTYDDMCINRYYTEEEIAQKQQVHVQYGEQFAQFHIICPRKTKQRMQDAGFVLVEEGNLSKERGTVAPDLGMILRLHVYQVYKFAKA